MARNSINNANSRYSKGGVTETYPTRLGWWERFIFPTSTSDVDYTIESKYSKRPDLLSYDVYGTPSYMWVILQYNNILDINTEFVEGASIVLPAPQRVKMEFT